MTDSDDDPSSRVLITVGGLVDEVGVSIGIYGEDLDPDELTRLLAISPSHSHRRGDRRGPRSPPHGYRQGAWILSDRCTAPQDPSATMERLLAKLPSDPALWSALGARFNVRTNFGVHFTGWNKGFELSPAVIRRLALLGATVGFDLYADGDEEEPDTDRGAPSA